MLIHRHGKLVKARVALGDHCPHCNGSGRLVQRHHCWRLWWHYQDCHETTDEPGLKTLGEVEQHLRQQSLTSVNVEAISPAGVVYAFVRDARKAVSQC